jgi:hypothetical protein
MANHKYIPTPQDMLYYFEAYVKETKKKPITVKDWVGKDGDQVDREKERPLTMEGFENYLFIKDIISDVSDYFENKEDRYKEFIPICRAIKRMIRQDQIEGGMAGIYNPSITQRLNGLVEKTDNKTDVTIKGVEVTVKRTGLPQINSEKDIH